MSENLYTFPQVEAIAEKAVKQALASILNLDIRIEQGEGEAMPSQYNETYYFTEKDGSISSVRLYGMSKKDTDNKFKNFLQKKISDAPKLKTFITETYRPRFMKKLSPTTQASYKVFLDNYIIPVLGEKKLDEINVAHIQEFYDWMATAKSHGCRENLNVDTIKRVSGLLGRLYKIAIDMKLVDDCPIKKTLLINEGKESGHHQALPDNEVERVKKLVPEMENEQQRLYMGLLVYTGMRREEIAGIGWEHINLKERYGRIERVVVYPDGKVPIIRNKTKTKSSTREFVIPEPLAQILESSRNKKGFIIHGKDETKPVPFSTLRRLYRAAFKQLGVEGYDNHDWRATFGTQLKEAGITSAQVADLMGHADTRMVETTYAPTRHESIMMHKNTLNKLNSWFQPVPSETL